MNDTNAATSSPTVSSPTGSNAAAPPYSTGHALLRPPPPFDFENPGSWPTWLLQFEDYSYATGLYAAEQQVQVRSMLYCMGPQARVVLASTPLGDAALQDLSLLKKAFGDHFVPPPNELYESARFHRRVQEPGESVDAFFTALRTMVKRCNYSSSSVEERLVRDRFIVGLQNQKLSDQLCRNPKLTLQEVLTYARQDEDAEKERQQRLRENAPPLDVDAAGVRRQKETSATRQDNTCGFCGHASHARSDCPARRAICNYCRKCGSSEVVCQEKNSVVNKQQPKPSASSIELSAVTEKHLNAKFIDVLVNGHCSRNLPKGATIKIPTTAAVPEMGRSDHTFVIVDGGDLCSKSGVPSHTADIDTAPSTSLLLYPPILGVPLECRAGSPVEETHTCVMEPGNIKSEPKSPYHLPDSQAVSPSECVDSVYPVGVAVSSADSRSSVPSTDNDDVDLPVAPSCPTGCDSTPSGMPVQSTSAVKTLPCENLCQDVGNTDSDNSQNVDLAPKANVSHLKHGQNSISEVVSSNPAGNGLRRAAAGFGKFSNRLHNKRCSNRMASLRYRARKIQDVQQAEDEIAMLTMTNASLRLEVRRIEDEIAYMKGVLRDTVVAKVPAQLHVIAQSKDK